MRTTARSMELRRQRTVAISDARGILDGAEGAGRDLSAQERERYDGLMAQIDGLMAQIDGEEGNAPAGRAGVGGDRRDRLADLERSGDQRLGGGAIDLPGGEGDRQQRAGDGFLTRSQSVAEYVRGLPGRDRSERNGPSLGEQLRYIVTGRGGAEVRDALLTAGTSGYLLTEGVSTDVIDFARAQSVLMRAGALTRPMETGRERVPRLESDPAAAWHIEGVQESSTVMDFGAVQLRARTLMALLRGSVELFEDSDPNDLTQLAQSALGKAFGIEVDRVGLRGAGVGAEPQGLLGAIAGDGGSLADLDANGAYLTPDDLSEAASVVEQANFMPTAIIMSPLVKGKIERSKSGDGIYLTSAGNLPGNIANLPRLGTTSIPNTLTVGTASGVCSEVYVGDFSQLAICPRTALTIEVLREGTVDSISAAASLGIVVRAYLRTDILIRRGSAFAIRTGVRTD